MQSSAVVLHAIWALAMAAMWEINLKLWWVCECRCTSSANSSTARRRCCRSWCRRCPTGWTTSPCAPPCCSPRPSPPSLCECSLRLLRDCRTMCYPSTHPLSLCMMPSCCHACRCSRLRASKSRLSVTPSPVNCLAHAVGKALAEAVCQRNEKHIGLQKCMSKGLWLRGCCVLGEQAGICGAGAGGRGCAAKAAAAHGQRSGRAAAPAAGRPAHAPTAAAARRRRCACYIQTPFHVNIRAAPSSVANIRVLDPLLFSCGGPPLKARSHACTFLHMPMLSGKGTRYCSPSSLCNHYLQRSAVLG